MHRFIVNMSKMVKAENVMKLMKAKEETPFLQLATISEVQLTYTKLLQIPKLKNSSEKLELFLN